MNTKGWTIKEWLHFHTNATPEDSFSALSNLLGLLDSSDPAWISVATPENLAHQWSVLQLKAGAVQLPLYGVPVAIKDNIDVQGFKTTGACPSYARDAPSDATVVSLLRNNGAIVLGKTNLDQFATGLVGVRSPYGKPTSVFSKKHVSGGLSSGLASVVGQGLVPLALGTDTAGLGRVPAMLNNLIGLKPSKGLLSCNGVIPACKSLDVVLIFALDLLDAQYAFDLLAKPDFENDPYLRALPSPPLFKFFRNPKAGKKIRVAVPIETPFYGEKENPKLFHKAVESFSALDSVEVLFVDFSALLELAKCLYEGPWVAERYAALESFYALNPDPKTLDPIVYKIVQTAKNFDAKDAFNFEYKRQKILQGLRTELLSKYDAFLVPTAPLNPTLEDLEKEPILVNSRQGTWTNFVNLADLAALLIPAGFRPDGLPFGVTLLGNTFTDYALLELASQYLRSTASQRFVGGLKDRSVGSGDALNFKIQQKIAKLLNSIELAVVGAHLSGLPLNWQLDKVGATLIEKTTTSPNYRLYALPKAGPVLKPGLRRVSDGGKNIEVEVYSVPLSKFGEFVLMVPEPLGIGSAQLLGGRWVKLFICEEFGYAANGAIDVTDFGGFRAYIESLESKKLGSKKISFKKVLIANRGEIAVRIEKTLKKLGILSVAVYSDPDKYAQHVLDADVAVPLHGSTAAETYLNIEKIVAAAQQTGAEAVIPGYGFLSENADFADRCKEEGIVFVGPSGDAIRKLGLKHSAREIAQNAGVPLVPGSGLIKSASEAREFAATIGYPVMVKSTAGGGGIGLQKVDLEEDIERVFQTVQHQGASYFGDSGVFIERFVEHARHVEVQILADGYGDAIALGERDCSLQRRNQKIIEETPAPNLPQKTRERLHSAAENLAKSMKYKSAGTVEFIYDSKRDEFYFLEVNTRLQVEHPITEMVTGYDLVEWMIYIAADSAPNLTAQKASLKVTGASMEARLYAENAVKNFRPSPGQITEVSFPSFARVDTWVLKGTTVSSEYDPTLAKIIVHGTDRADALAKLNRALEETVVQGVVTNVDYLRLIALLEVFSAVKFHTKILDSYEYEARALEVVSPGAYTTVQDYPGRVGLWRIGVPPSGPMDSYLFRAANRIVGNHEAAPGIEMTLIGPSLKFHYDAVVAIAGGEVNATLDDLPVDMYKPIHVSKGQTLAVGKLVSGCRLYLAIRNGIDVGAYLGLRLTFALGNLGGYNGRTLKFGDVLFVGQPGLSLCSLPAPVSAPAPLPKLLIPHLATKSWKIAVTCGPHGAPDIFKPEFVNTFFSSEWKIHYNLNRFGVRLVGPKPEWARLDGGEGGLHPSNAHDYVYLMGAINFTGDEPVILTCDGPSLGGFVCHAVVCEAEMWKVGQVKPGDTIQFVPVLYDSARALKSNMEKVLELLEGTFPLDVEKYRDQPESPVVQLLPALDRNPQVVYRQAGDRYVLVEYGEDKMDLNLSYRVHKLIEMVESHKTVGIVEMSQGVRSVLVEFDGSKVHQKRLLEILLAYEREILWVNKWSVPLKLVRLPMAFEDKKTLDAVKRYQETIRASAPWLPNNVDFIAKINGMEREDVRDLMYAARFLVLGLGDVFLGAPCAVPLQGELTARKYPLPLIGSKYNPLRTFTPNGTVGLGGMYMCIYTMESPGGYQLVGRTIPIWDKLSLGGHSVDGEGKEKPWLLTPFDQIEFYPVSEEELEVLTEQAQNGKYKVEISDTVFDHKKYLEWIQEHSAEIEKLKESKKIGEKLEEFKRLIQVSNQELLESSAPKSQEEETYPEDAEMVYSQYSGRFWKPLVQVGDEVEQGAGLVVVEAMKTEMTVTAPKSGKVLKIVHVNGDMVEAGDLVVVLE